MMDPETWLSALGIIALVAPAVLVLILGTLAVFDAPPSERMTTRIVQTLIGTSLLALIGATGLLLGMDLPRLSIKLVDWVSLERVHYHFAVKIVLDHLSLPFALLSLVLCVTIGSFATRYMHRDPGFFRFFLLYSVFVLGMVTASLADTIETLFFGWELVGLSSALLIGFFQDRPAPARNGLWVWIVYRVADAALLLAAVVMHHMTGEGDFDHLLGEEAWPMGVTNLDEYQALFVGVLLLIAAAGKSALIPFSGWLPRAMEGPTPSSAVFYGALSVHLGAFLLLRMSPLLNASLPLAMLTVILGLATVALSSLSASVQTDIKSALAYSSLAQVGLIVAEIGLGFRWLPLVHLVGHASLRTLQFLRAPTLLQDYHRLENAVGGRLSGPISGLIPARAQAWLYRFALERGSLDVILWQKVVRPITSAFEALDRLDRRWSNLSEPEALATVANTQEEEDRT
ncbi:MAG: oxidoreductase [Planctomycetia bacterium]|nr:oxidoreductase [Planctomycetia bacterium]